MKDSLNSLLQQRFQGHEAPVDANVWEGIQQQVAASAGGADGVQELFRERFQGHETPVDTSVWTNINSQLGHSAAAGTASSTIWGWAAAGVAAIAVTTAVLFWEPATPPVAPVVAVENTTTVLPSATVPEPEIGTVEVAHNTVNSGSTERPQVVTKTPLRPRSNTAEVEQQEPQQEVAQHTEAISETTTEGESVVKGIISDLTDRVIHQPVTALPEPGIALPRSETTPTEVATTTRTTPEILETPSPAQLPKLFMPNTFTPNGDGMNDTYTVDSDGYSAVLLRVYSLKSNALVFTTNTGAPWTGDGCEDGMYMVAVEAHTADGRSATEGKVVWLTRNRMN